PDLVDRKDEDRQRHCNGRREAASREPTQLVRGEEHVFSPYTRASTRAAESGPMIRIGIVDDHTIVRTGLRQFLSEQVDFQVTGEAANGKEAIELARKDEVDVLLLDISMPDQGVIDALAAIK